MTKRHGADLEKVGQKIRSGHLPEANQELTDWIKSQRKIAREALPTVASLYRRLRKPDAAIRLLHPIVRPSGTPPVPPTTTAEKAEYAAALIRLGAVLEAEEILKGLNSDEYPPADLFRAYAKIHQWDYSAAIAPLNKYLANSGGIEPYERKIARVNLAAALVATGNTGESRKVLEELLDDTRKTGDRLLEANLREISAQNEFFIGDFTKARAHLKEAESLIDVEESLDGFFVEKWKSLIQLAECPSHSHIASVHSIRAHAIQKQHWETARDIDFQLAVILRNESLLRTVYRGTPYPALRLRYESEAKKLNFALEDESDLLPGRELGDGGEFVVLDTETGENSNSPQVFKSGQLPQRTLMALNLDFYRPQRLAELHQNIYPGDFFSQL